MASNKRERAEQQEVREQEMIAALQEVARRLGPNVTLARFAVETGIGQGPVYRCFGSWRQLRIQAGLPSRVDFSLLVATYSRDEVLAAMQTAVTRHGEQLSQHTFCRESGISPGPIKRLFGSWGELRQSVGLSPQTPHSSRPRYSHQQTIDALRELVSRQGPVTVDTFCRHLGVSRQTVYRVGNWTSLHAAAGLPVPCPRPSREMLLTHLRRIVDEQGDVTRIRFCRELNISPETVDRLGPWRMLRRELDLPARACTSRPLWETNLAGALFDPEKHVPPERRAAVYAAMGISPPNGSTCAAGSPGDTVSHPEPDGR